MEGKNQGTILLDPCRQRSGSNSTQHGGARNAKLQDVLREIALYAAKYQFVVEAKHIMGITNRIPDWLSRWHELVARGSFTHMPKTRV